MRLCDIILKEEYISSSIDMQKTVSKVTADYEECDEETLLVIPGACKNPSLLYNVHARALLCGADVEVPESIAVIRAKNPRRAAAFVFSRFYNINYGKFKIIGITGTNGKSSTAAFAKCALEGVGMKIGMIGTGRISIGDEIKSDKYYSMTTPDPWILYPVLKEMELCGCDCVIMEVSSHALALEKVAPIPFDVAIFTNLSPEHLDFHIDMEAYYCEKKKLFYQSKLAIINVDDYYGRRLSAELVKNKITSGILWRADVFATDMESFGFSGGGYIYHGKNFTFKLNLKCAGVFNIYNSMLAITAATALGAAPCKVKAALSELPIIKGRYEIIKGEITVIIDYAHTDTAFKNILASIGKAKKADQSLTVVFGCGGERDKTKRPKMAAVAEEHADEIIVTADNSRSESIDDIISDIVQGFKKENFKIIKDRKCAIEYAITRAKSDSIVAIIGKGAEEYNIDADGYHNFDERKIINDAIKNRERRVI